LEAGLDMKPDDSPEEYRERLVAKRERQKN
jgi:hypothetical protein